MLEDIKRNAISKCRPVKKVHTLPPMENLCLVGQTSGRIKWIQPSGAPHTSNPIVAEFSEVFRAEV